MNFLMFHPEGYDSMPRGHEPDRFRSIENELLSRGHVSLRPEDIDRADIVLFNSGVWNLTDRGTEGGTCRYNSVVMSGVINRHIPVVWFDDFDHADARLTPGGWPGADDWNELKRFDFTLHDFARFGWAISRPGANKILYFMRKMCTSQSYPDYVLPLEYPVLDDYLLVSKDELFARPNDVCGLANISLQRAQSFIGLLRDRRLKADCDILVHYRRLEYDQWIARHRQAKLAVDVDASLGSERTLRLFSTAPILRGRTNHKLPFPLEDMKHWVVVGDFDGYITKEDVDKILTVVNDKDLLYDIYRRGAGFIRQHYSLEARTRYVVDHIEKFV
jgi:hypothetical protein